MRPASKNATRANPVLGVALVALLLGSTACGAASERPADVTTVGFESDGVSATPTPSATSDPSTPAPTTPSPVSAEERTLAAKAKEREKKQPNARIACVNPDGSLLGELIVSGVGTRENFTDAERKRTCDAMAARGGPGLKKGDR